MNPPTPTASSLPLQYRQLIPVLRGRGFDYVQAVQMIYVHLDHLISTGRMTGRAWGSAGRQKLQIHESQSAEVIEIVESAFRSSKISRTPIGGRAPPEPGMLQSEYGRWEYESHSDDEE